MLAIPGFILLVIRRKFHIPLAFLLILFMGEASFYSEILAGIMAGVFVAEMIHQTSGLAELKNPNISQLPRLALLALVLFCAAASTLGGLRQIRGYQPEINGQSLKMASFVRENTDPAATYLFIGRINEAEWFPWLFDRTPVFAPWGSEWKGEYAEQSEILTALRECQLNKSWTCMEDIQQEQSVSADLLVIPNKRWLVLAIKDTKAWDPIYEDELYLVWQRRE